MTSFSLIFFANNPLRLLSKNLRSVRTALNTSCNNSSIPASSPTSTHRIHRGPWIPLPGKLQRHVFGLFEELRRVAGQQVEVVHPRGGRRLEHVAPHQMVLPVDEILPRFGLVILLWKIREALEHFPRSNEGHRTYSVRLIYTRCTCRSSVSHDPPCGASCSPCLSDIGC